MNHQSAIIAFARAPVRVPLRFRAHSFAVCLRIRILLQSAYKTWEAETRRRQSVICGFLAERTLYCILILLPNTRRMRNAKTMLNQVDGGFPCLLRASLNYICSMCATLAHERTLTHMWTHAATGVCVDARLQNGYYSQVCNLQKALDFMRVPARVCNLDYC